LSSSVPTELPDRLANEKEEKVNSPLGGCNMSLETTRRRHVRIDCRTA